MNRFKTTTDIIETYQTKKDLTIAHISDIHFSRKTSMRSLNRLRDYLFKLKSDYVMITGDTIDIPDITKDKNKIRELITFLTDLGMNTKVIMALGNHDIVSDEDYHFFNKLNDLYNIYVLNDTSYHDDNLYVMGITLPNEYYYNVTTDESLDVLVAKLDTLKDKFKEMPKHIPKIALIHSPIKVAEKSALERLKNFDLVLCGHTHNGMVPDMLNWLFKGNSGIISPRNKLLPKIAKGKIESEINNHKITIIINGAITKLSAQSGKTLSNLNFLYNKSINKIIIKKKRGIKYE